MVLFGLTSVPTAAKDPPVNRLAEEKSPYLLQHAHNPVDWFPWGEEAFARARAENKPIFLSVGYSTCHWCHVMERESFENPEIAAFLNEHFVSIKVDREERPDVDAVYMAFVQATTGAGGWPMSVWLTPELKPFVAGTYFPPEDTAGRPGFLSVLQEISAAWPKDEKLIREEAGRMTERLQAFAATPPSTKEPLTASVLTAGLAEMERVFDAQDGGFGSAPKFPRPSELLFLFHEAARVGPDSKPGRRAIDMAALTLEKMAAGGLHDQLGGGFHRYSTDSRWHVPHFEKMLYDQAQLVEAYLIAYQVTGRPVFAQTARDILDYVLRDLTSPQGGFYSAEDADSLVQLGAQQKTEGAFYVWTAEEIQAALGEKRAEEFGYVYGVEADGNTSGEADPQGELRGKNVLSQQRTVAEAAKKFEVSEEEMAARLAASRQTLLALRGKRPRPHLDDKVITAWNGLMISAFAKGYRVLGEAKYLAAANRATDFLRQNLSVAGDVRLQRAWRDGVMEVGGFAEDYASLIRGLLDLYESSFEPARLEWAMALQKAQNELFLDAKHGGYFSSEGKDPSVLLRMKETYDGAEPSPNTLSALNLLRLAHVLGDPSWSKEAERTLQALATQMQKAPLATPMGLVALDVFLSPAQQIVLVGPADAPDTRAMLAAMGQKFLPGSVWALLDDEASRTFFAAQADFYRDLKTTEGKTTAYVCRDFVCRLPTTDMEEFRQEIASLGGP